MGDRMRYRDFADMDKWEESTREFPDSTERQLVRRIGTIEVRMWKSDDLPWGWAATDFGDSDFDEHSVIPERRYDTLEATMASCYKTMHDFGMIKEEGLLDRLFRPRPRPIP